MAGRLFDRLWKRSPFKRRRSSFLRSVLTGSVYRVSDLRGNTSLSDIRSKIDTMRNLAQDSQVSTVLSYYATDCTTTNSAGQIIWASSETEGLADLINSLFKRWKVNAYARDDILELATVGNLYKPTTVAYRDPSQPSMREGVVLDNNTIIDNDFDIIPAYKIPAEDIIHIWQMGDPLGYIFQPDESVKEYIIYPEEAVIHFSLGGLLGDYTIDSVNAKTGEPVTYDIQFAEPLLSAAVIPTQTLALLEDSMLLASLIRVIKFVNVDCSNAEEEEIQGILQQMKDAIEQQMSINTSNGDAQSFLNPQSPNNLIYLPKVNGTDAVSITDLNMAENTEADNKLMDHYENKKLSTLGVPKEALNYSSAEGLGAAGTVMSQRSSLYANILDRIMTAYKDGWTQALNMYFTQHSMSGYVDKFELHMNPIITTQSTIQFDKRDAALNQALSLVQLLKEAGVDERDAYGTGLIEILTEAFPTLGADVRSWHMNPNEEVGGGAPGEF